VDRKQREAVAVEIAATSYELVTKSPQVPGRVANVKMLN